MRRAVLPMGALAALLLAGCGAQPQPWVWNLPAGFPVPKVPQDNPMSVAKVALGRALFYDVRLSRNGTQACASCHAQRRAFTDGRATAQGSTGQVHPRNSQSLGNVAYAATLTWANPLLNTLERQALLPLLSEQPVELGWAGAEELLLRQLKEHPQTAARFEDAFEGQAQPVSLENVTRALASFQRTIISGDSPYDRWSAGDAGAISEAAKRGLQLFNSERLECYHCHGGFNFSDSIASAATPSPDMPFHNTGLYDLDGAGAYPAHNAGVFEVTARGGDMGRFRAPSLRNLAVTAPYFHDGSAATLDAVLDSYAAGGRVRAVTGNPNPLQSDLVRGFTLSASERSDLLAFLEALDDEAFLTAPSLGDPNAPSP